MRFRILLVLPLASVAACAPARPIVVAAPVAVIDSARQRADSIAAAVRAAAMAREASILSRATPEEVGMRSSTLDSMDDTITKLIRDGAAPGASIAVGRHGRLVRLTGYGVTDLRLGFPPVTDSTLYDLASLTKVIGATTAIMMLVDDGLINLDAPVKQYIPEWTGSIEKEAVTVRNLLLHNSGLAAGGNLWTKYHGHDEFRARVAAQELVYPTGTKSVYSDFSGMMMGFIAEQVSGMTLDRFLRERLLAPMGMHDSGFNPLSWAVGESMGTTAQNSMVSVQDPAHVWERIAPTEFSATTGGGAPLHGVVHDENAYAMGGVSGHAGLFSSARDLAVFAQMLMNHGIYAGHRYISAATIDTFTHRYNEYSSRALGWDTPTANSSAGEYFTMYSFGHTGFTGTSLWMDPERDVFVVLLTNRVNPTRANQKHLELRRVVADMVQQSITDMPVPKRVDPPRQR